MIGSIGFVDFYGITTGKSIGSGTIINKDGTILTCAHVVVDFQGTRSLPKGKVCVHIFLNLYCLESLIKAPVCLSEFSVILNVVEQYGWMFPKFMFRLY